MGQKDWGGVSTYSSWKYLEIIARCVDPENIHTPTPQGITVLVQLKLSFEICLQLYSHTDYSKIEDVRPEASWVYNYTKKEMIAVNEVNLVCFF